MSTKAILKKENSVDMVKWNTKALEVTHHMAYKLSIKVCGNSEGNMAKVK
jgi:hypothetical protein